jgi:hypothetical protein
LSGAFWRGCAAIVVLSIAGFSTLVSGGYKNGVTAPAVEPLPAVIFTSLLAGLALLALWRWERRTHDRR